jgi:hypothetical protein
VALEPQVRPQVLIALVCETNRQRIAQGLPAVRGDSRISAASQSHADDMVARGYFADNSPEGCDPMCRGAQHGYPSSLAENIFSGPGTAQEAVAGWMESPGPRANLLGGHAVIGAGVAWTGRAGPKWVQAFGDTVTDEFAITGLEPEYQGAPDPTATARAAREATEFAPRYIQAFRLNDRTPQIWVRALVLNQAQLERLDRIRKHLPAKYHVRGKDTSHPVRITVRRGGRALSYRREAHRGFLSVRLRMPRGSGPVTVTLYAGEMKRVAVLRGKRNY